MRKERKKLNVSGLPLYFTVHQSVQAESQPWTDFGQCKWTCLVFNLRKNTDVATSCLSPARAAAERAHCVCSLQCWCWQVHSRCQRLAEVCDGLERAQSAVLPGCPETSCLHRWGSSQSCWRWFLPEIWASSFLIPNTRVEKQKVERNVKRRILTFQPWGLKNFCDSGTHLTSSDYKLLVKVMRILF